MLTRRALIALLTGTADTLNRPTPDVGNLLLTVPKPCIPHPVARDSGPDSIAAVERAHILRILRECGGNQTAAARRMGLSRRSLAYRIKRYSGPDWRRTINLPQ